MAKAFAHKPDLCLDFDGTIHSYTSGWQGATIIPDPPVPGALRWIWHASPYWKINIYSSRSKESGAVQAMQRWFRHHIERELAANPDWMWRETVAECATMFMITLVFPTMKAAANMPIDDRAICFNGNWSDPQLDPEILLQFKPWNKRPPNQATLPSHLQSLINNVESKDLAIHLEAAIIKELYGPITR